MPRKTSSKTRSLERKLRGAKSALKGLAFEVKVANWLAEKGYSTRKLRYKTKRLGEVDIIAERRVFLRRKVLFVECKDKARITLRDFHRFVAKFEKFLKREPNACGLFVYRGELEKDVKDYYRKILDPELAELIELKKWKR